MAVVRTFHRRTWAIVLVVLGALAVASGGALWATNTVTFGGSDTRPLVARRPPTSSPPVSDPPSTCRSPLTSDAPLRLWIGGDSLAGSLGPVLGTTAGNTGIVQPVFDSRVSSGLTSPGFFDWPKHATQEMARLDPEVVVFIIDTNDSDLARTQSSTNGVPDWKSKYGELVAQMLDILSAPDSHRTVYWVGGPTIRDSTIDAGVRQLNDVARTVVQRHAHATYVDAYHLFSDPQGHFSFTLPDKSGKSVLARADDGVHFTPAGADLLGQAIFGSLDTQCHLLRQAVPGSPKSVIETPGSTQIGPSTRTPTTNRPSPPPTPPPTPPPPPPTQQSLVTVPSLLPTSKTSPS